MINKITVIGTALLLTVAHSIGQTIILGQYPKTVPEGKKWSIPTNKELLVELSNGSFQSGTLCNASVMSNPRILSGIVEGEYGRPNEVYSIIFKELNKVAYTNEVTYSIIPLGIADKNFSLSELKYKKANEVGKKQIVFYPGQKVYVSQCIQSIQLTEENLSAKELSEIKNKENEKIVLEQKKKQDETDKKSKAEQDRRNKILNSNEYFYSKDLTNISDIKITYQETALKIINNFLQEFKTQYLNSYTDKIANYQNNIRTGSDEYAMFDFSLYFDKSGKLNKITINRVLVKGQGSNDIELDKKWFDQLASNISINKPPIINLDGKDYPVNCYFLAFFTFYESSSTSTVQFSKNKKGEITITENRSSLSNETVTQLLKSSDKTATLEKGKYTATVNTTNNKYRLTHFQNFDKKENVFTTDNKDEIFTVQKL